MSAEGVAASAQCLCRAQVRLLFFAGVAVAWERRALVGTDGGILGRPQSKLPWGLSTILPLEPVWARRSDVGAAPAGEADELALRIDLDKPNGVTFVSLKFCDWDGKKLMVCHLQLSKRLLKSSVDISRLLSVCHRHVSIARCRLHACRLTQILIKFYLGCQ